MKKYLFPALALGLVMTSCQSDEPFAPGEGGEKQVTFTLNVPGELGTRAGTEDNNSGVGGWTNTQGNVSYTLVLSAEGHNQTYTKENVTGNTVTFSPTVVLGREYTVTAYAHFSDKAQENLTSITETKGINDESKDVYFFTTKENVSKPTINFADGTSYNFDLKRPYAKLRLIAEDYNVEEGIGKPITDITKVAVSYNNEVYTVFDAVEGEFKTKATKSYTKSWDANYYEKNVTSGDKTIFADYIPVNGTDVAPFTVTVEYTNGETYTRKFNQDIPVKRNALTTLKGNFFTAGAEITVKVEDAFDNNSSKEYDLKFTAKEVQAALDAAPAGETTTIYLGATIEGDVIEHQKADRKVIIDGMGNKWNGTIKIHNGSGYNNGEITVKKVNFETSDTERNFIEALDFGEENGVSRRYSNNITVDSCTFTSPATRSINEGVVGVQVKSSKNVKVLNCKANNIHSLLQAQSCDENVIVKDAKINGCKNGVAFKAVKNAVVEGCEITATAYGIRFDGNQNNYGITVKNNKVTAVQPLIVRKMTGKDNTITLEGDNTLTTTADYQIVITNGNDDAEYVKPTGTYTLNGVDNFLVYPRDYYYPIASWDEFTAALAANEPKIKLTADIVYDDNYQLQKSVDIDLNDMSMTLPMLNIHTKTTLKNGTINGKVYARKNSDIVFNDVKFSGAVADNLSTEGHLAIQGGCTKLYAKDCLFSPTSVSGSQTKPLSFEGGSTIMKFENCEFKSSPYKKQVYFNSLSATGSLDFTNCNFNSKTPNIMFAATCPLTNVTMSGTTKLSSVTFEINRAKDAVTEDDLAYLRTLIANNSFSSVRVFYAGGSSEYIR